MLNISRKEGNVYLTMHSTHFIYGYIASDMVKDHLDSERANCCHMGYSFRLAARYLLYTLKYRQNNTYNDLCYTSHGALAGTRNSSTMKDRSDGPSHQGATSRFVLNTSIKQNKNVF